MFKNLYKILQISPSATKDQIKKAYRTLAKQFHPDFNPHDPNANRKMEAINEAYATLIDPLKRTEYDRKLRYHQYISPNQSRTPHSGTGEEISLWDDISTEVKVVGSLLFSGLIVWGISKIIGK